MTQYMRVPANMISAGKKAAAILSPLTNQLTRTGCREISRVSDVDVWNDLPEAAKAAAPNLPHDPNSFWANLAKCGGPLLGPFDTYEDAVEAEQRWIIKHRLATS